MWLTLNINSMKLKTGLILFLLGTLFSCLNVDYKKKEERQTLVSYGDSLFVKSSYIDDVWKPEYKYALCLPNDVSSELSSKIAQYLIRNPYQLNPKNTLVFSDADKNALNGVVGGFTIVSNTIGNLASDKPANTDSLLTVSSAVVISIKNVASQNSEKDCNYKLMRLDTIEVSVEPLPLPADMKNISREVVSSSYVDGKTFYKIKTLNNRIAFICSSQLDDAWKSSYQYALLIPEKAELTILGELVRVFANTKRKYTTQNTLILCCKRFVEPVKEVIDGSAVMVASDIFESGKVLNVMEATIEHLSKEAGGEFNYKMEKL